MRRAIAYAAARRARRARTASRIDARERAASRARRRRGTAPSRAAPAPPRNSSAAPKPGQCVLDHARAGAPRDFYGIIAAARIDDERSPRRTAPTRGTPRVRAAASRVITTSDRGSGPDMRASVRRSAACAVPRDATSRADSTWFANRAAARTREAHADERACSSSAPRRSATSSTRSRIVADIRRAPPGHARSTGSPRTASRRWSRCDPDVRRVDPGRAAALAPRAVRAARRGARSARSGATLRRDALRRRSSTCRSRSRAR